MDKIINSEKLPPGIKSWFALYQQFMAVNGQANQICVEVIDINKSIEIADETRTTYLFDVTFVKDQIIKDYESIALSKLDATALKYYINVSVDATKHFSSNSNIWPDKAVNLITSILNTLET